MKVILDTNFLIYCAKKKIDYEEEITNLVQGKYDLVVPSYVLEELGRLKVTSKKYSDRTAIELAIKLLKVNNVKIIKIEGKNTDDAIIKASVDNIVATLDLGLIRQVDKTIIVRGKKKLSFR